MESVLEQGYRIEFGYVDGWHTFDYVLIYFFYLDKLMQTDGVIGFNDCGWRAIHKVLKFMKTHRRYEEIYVGLARIFRGRNVFRTSARKFLDFQYNDRYYRKTEDWEPISKFYARF